jgi:hypothetical protein
MTLKETINLIADVSKQPAATFERLVIRLLEKHSADLSKRFYSSVRFEDTPDFEADALILPGLFDGGKDTIVEIRYISKPLVTLIRFRLENILEKTKPLHNKKFSFLFVVPLELRKIDKDKLFRFTRDKYPDLDFHFWDVSHLTPLFNKYAEFFSDLIPQANTKALKNIVDKSLQFKDWRKERERLIENLKESLPKDDLVLFLGAGVSASAGLPDWSSLLSQLLVSLISKNLPPEMEVSVESKLALADSLQKLNSSPLLEARYVNSGIGEQFEEEISKILYRDANNDTTSDLIKAIGNLCIPPRGALGVQAIVNYNFDDLVEKQLKRLSLRHRSIYRDVDIPTKEELGIFHVHGFLPQETKNYEGISESLLVFSEKNYHTVMQDPYFWSNLIQLNFFRENTCLLAGLSGTDPNLRRLLEIAKRKTKVAKHYILLKRTPNDFFIKDFKREKISQDDKLIETINEIHHNLHEKSFDELGLNIIWYENHSEIPEILNLLNTKK